MARPRKGVTKANLLQVDRYFSLALKQNRLFNLSSSKNLEIFYYAKEAYNKLPSIDWKNDITKKNSIDNRIAALQIWVDEYVPAEKWQRCLLTLLQNKSRKKLKLRRLDLQLDIYLIVKALARKQKMSLGATIYKLAKPAFNKICKAELARDIGIKNSLPIKAGVNPKPRRVRA